MTTIKYVICFGSLFCSLTILVGCSQVGDSIATLNSLITAITRAPGDWQQTIETALDGGANLSNEVRNDIQYLLREGSNAFNSQIECRVDIIGRRVKQGLEEIRHNLRPSEYPMPEKYPYLCLVSPSTIIIERRDPYKETLNFSTTAIHFQGIDFLEKRLTVSLEYEDGQPVSAAMPKAEVSTNYLAVVDLRGVDATTVSWERNPTLVVKGFDPGNTVNSTTVFENPPPSRQCPQVTYSITHLRSQEASCNQPQTVTVEGLEFPGRTSLRQGTPVSGGRIAWVCGRSNEDESCPSNTNYIEVHRRENDRAFYIHCQFRVPINTLPLSCQ